MYHDQNPPLSAAESTTFTTDFVGSNLTKLSISKATHLATSISQHPVLLDRKRFCLVVHSSDLATHEVVQACDSGGRP